ncbi:GDSL-type esterase/lipase family protein [Sphaerospermopsis kisseleviana CS-549]|uniref:G-D-S-L family lipolytic protein n=2 Tax=Sphaerospermopsis TaxID=752201 RepID=A0A479ZR34_9CYAN|nr:MULTISPECIES: GDSL-type esterase/lipase family protein [Sphaerospermopsis]MDB9441134.1 GDSL-type esterase/lipase family protein [Sphaerospermopsis kisseleviana CS-549]BAZ81808.1 G-D-S-L family lipolytic protein [Sphaerospermopsis kisseleviana NIES-73]GCL34925.1 G-D-S-L family lipolytic protein [Sphaerospermopsis reniformis]
MQTVKPSSSMLSITPKLCQPLKIVALGDSLVYGYGDYEKGGWVEQLRRWWMLPDSVGHVLYNLGVRGDRIQQVSQRLEVEFRHRGEIRNRVPDLIILSVGVNDSPRLGRPTGKNYTDFAEFETAIATLLDQAQQLCPVLFVGMVPVDESKMPFLDCLYYNHADQYRYKEATRQACEQRKIPYLDIFDQWISHSQIWRSERMTADGLHPNTLGYQDLLEAVLNWSELSQYHCQVDYHLKLEHT